MNIGGLQVSGRALLAPMAGVSDRAFRELCVSFGAALVTGEMVSSKGLCYHDRKTESLLTLGEEERPAGVQLFGDDPDCMARSVALAMQYRPDFIDININTRISPSRTLPFLRTMWVLVRRLLRNMLQRRSKKKLMV